LVLILFLKLQIGYSWLICLPSTTLPAAICSYASQNTALFAIDPSADSEIDTKRIEGERIIKKAAIEAGAIEEQLAIEWRTGRVIVTVDSAITYIKGRKDDDVGVEINYDDNLENIIPEEGEDDDDKEEENGTDITKIARAINSAFKQEEEGSVGFSIPVYHAIEVTTPGATDELSGIMFESYKGFDVIIDMIDPKSKKRKIVEGRLVERNDEHTIVNQKGRMRKLKNYTVESVKLPPAKREKGSRK